MPARVMPDVVKIGVSFLRGQTEVTDLITAAGGDAKNIRGEMITEPTFPYVRLTRIASTTIMNRPFELEQVTLQFEVWGGNDRQAERIAQTIRALLPQLEGFTEAGEGHISGVQVGSLSQLPDETFSPPRRRYIGSVDLFTRPN